MAFITNYNLSRIIRQISMDNDDIIGEIYKRKIYFFSHYEEKYLNAFHEFCRDPESIITELYIKVKTADTFNMVFEGGIPAYHNDKQCERLNSSYINFEIPFEIHERANEKEDKEDYIKRFRDWFKNYYYLLEEDENEEFVKQLEITWNVKILPTEIKKRNSGVIEFENLNLQELEARIDHLIVKAGKYFTNYPDKQELIRRFAKYTFLAYTDKAIYRNNTNYSDDEVKEFLKEYDERFKIPVKNYLLEYYRVKYNPELNFEGMLLNQLGFQPCTLCVGESELINRNGSFDNVNEEDLPF